jgi:cytochrome c biogenesis protein CcdA/glutaredoxin
MAARRALLLALTALLALLAGLVTALAASSIPAHAEEPGPGPSIVLFYGEGCPHCAAERAFLAALLADRPDVVLTEYEVYGNADNAELMVRTAEERGFEAVGVPITIIGDRAWIGYDDTTGAEIAAALGPAPTTPTVPAAPVSSAGLVDVPLVGTVDTASMSLLAATAAIGFVDGINPCSLWVLSLLLAMVLNRGSRGRVLLVGGVFLTVTAGMYAVFMLGMYSAASYLSALGWLRLLVALVAGVFGVLQLKDGLGIAAGPSLSISPSHRPGLYARMRAVATPEGALATTLLGTVVLAVAVSLLETPCTAGLPLLWTTLLADQGVGFAQAAGLFAVYMALFLLDELLIFTVAVVTLRATRLQERHGRALKLVAGSVLVTLAATMLLAPDAMTTLVGTLVVFALALALAAVLYAVSSGRSSGRSPGSPTDGSSVASTTAPSASTSRTTP